MSEDAQGRDEQGDAQWTRRPCTRGPWTRKPRAWLDEGQNVASAFTASMNRQGERPDEGQDVASAFTANMNRKGERPDEGQNVASVATASMNRMLESKRWARRRRAVEMGEEAQG